MNSTYFSIIVPTLNEEYYLPKLLSSLTKQTFTKFELIVCDGKSTDKTVDLVSTYESRLPKVFVIRSMKRNVSYQRNLGARAAVGKYLIFLDADVWLAPDFLKKVFAFIRKEKLLLMTTWLLSDSGDLIDEMLVLLSNFAIEVGRYTNKAYLPGFNMIVQKKLFERLGGFNERIRFGEDHEFAFRARAHNQAIGFVKNARLTLSLRRFKSEGRAQVLRKYIYSTTHFLLRGPTTRVLFEYKMGGHYHNSKNIKT